MTTATTQHVRWFDPALTLAGGAALGATAHLWLGVPAAAIAIALTVLAVIGVTAGRYAPTPARPYHGLGPANRLSLARAVVIAGLAGLLPYPEFTAAHAWWLVAAALAALVLDGLDGRVARATGTASDFGARFDEELDALLIMVLCIHVWLLGHVGAWVLLIGAMRYAFVGGGCILPALRRPLPPSQRRRAICVLQIVALLAALAPATGTAVAAALLAAALAALSLSFAVDVHWLLRHHPTELDSGGTR